MTARVSPPLRQDGGWPDRDGQGLERPKAPPELRAGTRGDGSHAWGGDVEPGPGGTGVTPGEEMCDLPRGS